MTHNNFTPDPKSPHLRYTEDLEHRSNTDYINCGRFHWGWTHHLWVRKKWWIKQHELFLNFHFKKKSQKRIDVRTFCYKFTSECYLKSILKGYVTPYVLRFLIMTPACERNLIWILVSQWYGHDVCWILRYSLELLCRSAFLSDSVRVTRLRDISQYDATCKSRLHVCMAVQHLSRLPGIGHKILPPL